MNEIEVAALPIEPCPMCEAKGGWMRHSLTPTSPKHQEGNPDYIVCFFCRGSGRVALPSWIEPRKAE